MFVRKAKVAMRPDGVPACSRRSRLGLIGIVVVACSALSVEVTHAAGGYYTKAQAQAGATEYYKVCAICHGDHLQGGVGPALSGQQFLSVSQFQQLTVRYLFHFMSTHMPQNAPGSLTQTQYLDLMAYVLQVNGYPAGSHALTPDKKEMEAIKIEPQH